MKIKAGFLGELRKVYWRRTEKIKWSEKVPNEQVS